VCVCENEKRKNLFFIIRNNINQILFAAAAAAKLQTTMLIYLCGCWAAFQSKTALI
jgi:hypothetical protein